MQMEKELGLGSALGSDGATFMQMEKGSIELWTQLSCNGQSQSYSHCTMAQYFFFVLGSSRAH